MNRDDISDNVKEFLLIHGFEIPEEKPEEWVYKRKLELLELSLESRHTPPEAEFAPLQFGSPSLNRMNPYDVFQLLKEEMLYIVNDNYLTPVLLGHFHTLFSDVG